MESSSSSSAKVQDPCYFLEDALRALLKCLGVETKPPQEDPPSSSQDDPPSATTTTTTKTTTTTTTTSTDLEADPPSTTETQANSEVVVGSELRALTTLSVPSRPSLSNGSGPQIN